MGRKIKQLLRLNQNWAFIFEARYLEKEILSEMQQRIVKSFLDVLIMRELRKEPKSAYDIIFFIQKRFRLLMSSGTVYSNIYFLERDGLIQGNMSKRRRVYTLTDKGKKTIQAIIDVNGTVQLFIANVLSGSIE
jgi:DNA-binding PadR family transcriptional regulator